MAEKIDVYEDILEKNDRIAASNRKMMGRAFCVNIMSSPGAGKTTLLENTLKTIGGKYRTAVIEGDMSTSNDANRVKRFLKPGSVVQIRTENFGGGCHLDAKMVSGAVKKLGMPKRKFDLVIIENVGNLICPADFNLGEDKKIVMLSVTEGDDKPLKYPVMFQAADLVVLNKADLLKHVDFSVKKAEANIRKINQNTKIIKISAAKGTGLAGWYSALDEWIKDA